MLVWFWVSGACSFLSDVGAREGWGFGLMGRADLCGIEGREERDDGTKGGEEEGGRREAVVGIAVIAMAYTAYEDRIIVCNMPSTDLVIWSGWKLPLVLIRQSLVSPALRESNRVSSCPTPNAMHR